MCAFASVCARPCPPRGWRRYTPGNPFFPFSSVFPFLRPLLPDVSVCWASTKYLVDCRILPRLLAAFWFVAVCWVCGGLLVDAAWFVADLLVDRSCAVRGKRYHMIIRVRTWQVPPSLRNGGPKMEIRFAWFGWLASLVSPPPSRWRPCIHFSQKYSDVNL